MDIQKLMTKRVAWVKSGDSLSSAARAMWDADCGAVPVLDPANEEVVGIITDRDICMASWSRNQPPSSICVSEVMSHHVTTCFPTDSVAAVEALMRSEQVRRIPVVDHERRLIGIVSLADIAVATQFDLVDANARDVATVLAGISTRRSAALPH